MKEAAAFAERATRFCEFIEDAAKLSLRELVMTARVRVLELYCAGLELPVGEPGGADSGPDPQPPVDWPGFDRFEYYFETLNLFDLEGVVGAGMLSDDLLDIYFDVRRGLALWRSGVSPASAVWEWRFHFDAHWGNHAVGALRALHHACREV